ncbi:two-component system response regulator KdpE [soil metagenome]
MYKQNASLIVLIEDEAPIRRFLKMSLVDHGFAFKEASNGKDGLELIANSKPDIVILDLGLPDMDGLCVTKQLRQWSDVPLIVLSARGQEQDKIEVLDAGADDYLTKPFGIAELLARIRVAQRHTANGAATATEATTCFGEVELDLVRRQVKVAGESVHLTPNEYKILCFLIKHAGKVITHNVLLKEVWGVGYQQETHYLRVYMAQLRSKLERDPGHPKHLITEPGIGYRLKVS